jgi:serine/threonine-protein kinase
MSEKHFQSPAFSKNGLPPDDSQASEKISANPTTPEPPNNNNSSNQDDNKDFVNEELRSYGETEEVALLNFPPKTESSANSSGSDAEKMPKTLTPEVFASGSIPSGTKLGHFIIKNFIGGGGMGRVYLANDTALDRNVAIKVLPRQRANDSSIVARFMNEAKSAARLNHEHVAQVYFAGEQAGIPFIVFEYVEGTNVRTMVDDFDAFPLPQALNYLIQVSHALAHAAEHGVVHRDVKPSNILITKEGRAKLIDMGLARLLDPSESQNDLTASGVTLGTFDYISPEQARDPRNADIRSDIYSLGCTFFFMLSGRPPFPEGTVLQKLLQHQGDEPPDIRSFQQNIPAEVALLIQKMMAKDPRQRFQTPAVLIEALVNVAKTLGLQPAGPGKLNWAMFPHSKTPRFLKHLPWITAVAFLIVAVFLMNLYLEQLGRLEPPKLPEIGQTATVSPVPNQSSGTPLPVVPPVKDPGNTDEDKIRGHQPTNVPAFSIVSYIPPTVTQKSVHSLILAAVGWDKFGAGLRPEFIPLAGRLSFIPHSSRSPDSSAPSDSPTSSDSPRPLGGTLSVLAIRRNIDFASNFQEKPFIESSGLPKQRCVDPSGETPGAYPSLAVALADAEKQTTIELKWNNYMKVDPLAFAGQQLKFVAAAGYSPILLFEPSDSLYVSQNSRNMMTVGSSELEFNGLAVEMRIRQGVLAQDWSLFELTGGNKLTFSRCCLTIRNKAISDNSAYHDDVAFFRNGTSPVGIKTATVDSVTETPATSLTSTNIPPTSFSTTTSPSAGFSTAGSSADDEFSATSLNVPEQLSLSVTDSFIRGEAVVLQCDVPQTVDFRVKKSLIALAKPFLQTEDTKRTLPQDSVIRLRLEQTTFCGRLPFIYQSRNSFATEPMRVDVGVWNSIFFLNHVPLAVFRGAPSTQSAFDYLQWNGKSNYFQNVSYGWKFSPTPSALGVGVTYEMPIEEWKERMNPAIEKDARFTTKIDVFHFDEIYKPTHRLLPQDLVPTFLPESQATEKERTSTGIPNDTLNWLPRSWTGNE